MNQRLSPGVSTSGGQEVSRGLMVRDGWVCTVWGSATSPDGAPSTTQSPQQLPEFNEWNLLGNWAEGGPVWPGAGHRHHSEEFGRSCKQGVTAD